ncbi:MAG: hypothetical protein ACFCU1_12875 [Sumerlaeia bacterium]
MRHSPRRVSRLHRGLRSNAVQAWVVIMRFREFVPPVTALADCTVVLWFFAFAHGLTGVGSLPVAWGALLFSAALLFSSTVTYKVCFALVLAMGWSAWENRAFGSVITLFALQFCLYQGLQGFRTRRNYLGAAQSVVSAFVISWVVMNRGALLNAPAQELFVSALSTAILILWVVVYIIVKKNAPRRDRRSHDIRSRTINAHAKPQKEAFA